LVIARMSRSTVAIVRTRPETVLEDYYRLMNLAGYQGVIAKDAETALKVNISWHFFYRRPRRRRGNWRA
jgi:hypothetical protein